MKGFRQLIILIIFVLACGASAFAQNVTVAGSTGADGSYATLKDAFDAINTNTNQTGNTITLTVIGDTNEGTSTALLNEPSGGLWSLLKIIPSGARTITGATTAGSPLVDLNGADNVLIDGLNAAGNSLTISNTTVASTSGTSTIRLINDATNNTITNCTILSSSTVTVGTTPGGAIVFGTGTTTGNDNNTVSNNNVGPAGANLPIKLISSVGSTGSLAAANSGNVINNNNLYDFFGTGAASVTGMDIRQGSDNWTISNNRIYQTAVRTFTATALRYSGITINQSTSLPLGSFTVSGNIIGFGAANGTGTTTITGSTNEFRGLDLISVGTSVATSVQGNKVSGINQTTGRNSTTNGSSAFIGVSVGTTGGLFNIGTVTGNSIGSLDGSSTIVVNSTSTTTSTAPVIGIYDFSFSNSNIANNQIGAITIQGGGTVVGFRGILVQGTAGQSVTITNNTVGGTNSGGITDTQVGSYAMYGIQATTTNVNITGNTVRNLIGNSNGAVVTMSGITASSGSTGASTISQNTISGLTNTSSGATTGAIYAMDLTLPTAANVVERNFVENISVISTATAYQLWGIVIRGAGTTTFKNNMVRLGFDAAGNSITTGYSIAGIREIAGGTNNFYHNTVYIGGSGVASVSNTYGFFSDVVTNNRNYLNNIFWNARSNATGTIANVAIRVGGTAANPAGLTSNYNDLYASGEGGNVGVFNGLIIPTLADWQTATGQDANSKSVDPVLISTTNLHLQANSPMINMGTTVPAVTDDFDGQARDSMPDIGADEFVGAVTMPGALSFDSATYTVNEAVSTATITVIRTGGSDGMVSVDYATVAGGTATGGASCGGGVDYINTSGTLIFGNGVVSQSFNVTICNDSTFEGDETVNLALNNATGGAILGTLNNAVLTITDDDEPPPTGMLSISDARVKEGDSGTVTMTFTVTLTSNNLQQNTGTTPIVSVQYSTANGTAIAGTDYVATSGTLSFTAGQMTKSIDVMVIGDTLKEPNETFFVHLSNPSNATITDGTSVGIIIDDDRSYVSDFDNDKKSDFSVFRPSNGYWYTLQSSDGTANVFNFGQNGDSIVPNDYDGDGKTDIAVYHPSNGVWRIQQSTNGFTAIQFGDTNDVPQAADFTGDGNSELVVWRPSTGIWYVYDLTTNTYTGFQFGISTDKPAVGDYDGDGKADYAVFRQADGMWYIQGSTAGFYSMQFGIASDTIVPADYDGDGKTDIAVYRPSTGTWYIQQTTNGFRAIQFGEDTDIPVPADYDGDGISDIAVWRPSNGVWYVINSSNNSVTYQQWGQNGDIPVPNGYIR